MILSIGAIYAFLMYNNHLSTNSSIEYWLATLKTWRQVTPDTFISLRRQIGLDTKAQFFKETKATIAEP